MKNNTVAITGGSSGIGKCLAYRFADAGANISLCALESEKDNLEKIKQELTAKGVRVQYSLTDVSNADSCKKFIEDTAAYFGGIDVLICNAGISMRSLFKDADLSVIKRMMDVNFWGVVYCTKFGLPYLLKSKGSLVGVSSIAGKKGLPLRTGYSAAKFAVEGFLETLRVEHMHDGLHVLVACPNFVATAIHSKVLTKNGAELGTKGGSFVNKNRLSTPETIAQGIFDGVIGRKRDVVFSLSGKIINLLNTLLPAVSDKIIYDHVAKETDSPLKR